MKHTLFASFALLGSMAAPAFATNYTVNSTADPAFTSVNAATGQITGGAGIGTVTLRSAVIAANSTGAGPHTINVPADTYTLSAENPNNPGGMATIGLSDLQIGSHLSTITLQGTGGTAKIVQSVAGSDVITTGFQADGLTPAVVNLTLSNLEITGGTFTGVFVGADDGFGNVSSTTITNCNIHDNSNGDATFGQGGGLQGNTGHLTISNTTFSNNSATHALKGQGGAIYYSIPNSTGQGSTGKLSITNCTFTSNSSALSGGIGGGAIYANVAGPGTNVSITGCTFTSNSTTAGSDGGALAIDGTRTTDISKNIFITNSVSGSGRGGAIVVNNGATNINYNRFSGNTATTGNHIHHSTGNASLVNADNNWWQSNTGPAANSITGATVTATKWLRFTHSSSPTTVHVLAPGKSSTVTASFLTNSASESISTADLTTVIGQPISFGSAAFGSLSGTHTEVQADGTASATFTAGSVAGAGSATATVHGAALAAPITVLASEFSVAAGNASENAGSVSLTVTRSSSTSGAVTVDYSLNAGTATAGSEFDATGGTLSFANGETTKTIVVPITDDSTVELNETFSAVLSNPSSGTIVTSTATGTINNDDSSVASISGSIVTEGDSGTASLTFTVSLTNPSDANVTVTRETTTAGSAAAGTDFTALSAATFTVPAGDTTASFNVSVIGDNDVESNETVSAKISNIGTSGRSVTLGTATVSGTIIDDDPLLVAGTGALGVNIGVSGKLKISSLLGLTSIVEGRTVSLVSVQGTPTTAGGTVTLVDGWIHYQPPAGFTGTDSFTYTITDGVQTVTGTVNISANALVGKTFNIYQLVDEGAGKRVLCLGIPGRNYKLESSGDLSTWTPIGSPLACPASGAMSLLDPGPLPPTRFYRVVEVAIP